MYCDNVKCKASYLSIKPVKASDWLILLQLGGAHLEHLHREGGG